MMSVGPICRLLDSTEGKPPLLGGKHAGQKTIRKDGFLEEVLEFPRRKAGDNTGSLEETHLENMFFQALDEPHLVNPQVRGGFR